MASDPTVNFTPLCFDRSDFGRQDFNVEKFLLKARRRGNSFEEIREDLRLFLKIIQNSMIELINKDYADFVQLSSNLAGLRGAVDKLNTEVTDLVGDFNEISSKIQQSVDLLSNKFEEKTKIRSEIDHVHAVIAAFHKLDQLKSVICVEHKRKDTAFLDRINFHLLELKCLSVVKNEELGSEFQQNFLHCVDLYQNVLEKLLVEEIRSLLLVTNNKKRSELLNKVLISFHACGRVDSAHALFLNEFVDSDIRQIFSSKKSLHPADKPTLLNQVLNCLVELYKKYIPFFVASNTDCQIPNFLSDCLLTALLSCLDDKFNDLLFPTDSVVFRKSYLLLMQFFETWFNECRKYLSDNRNSQPINHGLVRMILNKFNLSVYFQLRKQDILTNLEKTFDLKNLTSVNISKNNGFSLVCTSTLLNCIQQIWADDDDGVYLPPITSKCYELAFLLLNRFEHFVGDFSREISSKDASKSTMDHSSTVNGTPNSEVKVTVRSTPGNFTQLDIERVVNIASDIFELERIFKNFHQVVIVPKLKPRVFIQNSATLEDLSVDSIHNAQIYDQCLSNSFRKLHVRVDCLIGETLRDVLSHKVASHLSAVSEIPRQYRWTRKELPSQASLYIGQAFQSLREFVEFSNGRLPADHISATVSSILSNVIQSYAADIKSVLESVNKISSSLSKLKRSGKSATNVPDASATTASDDDKIRLQLNLDVKEFNKLVANLQLPVDSCDMNLLDEIINAKFEQ